VASVKTPLLRKLERVLSRRFPAPATVRLEEHDGIIGVVTSTEFSGMDSIDRQDVIGDIVKANLSSEERRQVQVIVGVTPDEETGYLAGEA
jgi:acid stress-induced BolA-like protein IbaG/YrbA